MPIEVVRHATLRSQDHDRAAMCELIGCRVEHIAKAYGFR